jgi:hypothetical protein
VEYSTFVRLGKLWDKGIIKAISKPANP